MTTADPIPSASAPAVDVQVVTSADAGVLGVAVTSDADVPAAIGLSRETLTGWGFAGRSGQTLALPGDGATVVAVGVGAADAVDDVVLRDAAGSFARAAARHARIATDLAGAAGVDAEQAARAVVEGALLARYRYDAHRTAADAVALAGLTLVVPADRVEAARRGVRTGLVMARAAALARDLANTPPGHLNAPDLADVAVRLGREHGLEVTVWDKKQLVEMGCGGLLGVNAGSAHEPRMIRVVYRPSGAPTGHLGLVGKGITYDSGGISLKPSDEMHAAMKMDMAGAGAALAAMTVLADLGATAQVSAFLACTDNMPSSHATKLGDVLVTRAGRTIEVMNTDAEGRLVMVDAIALAKEDGVDAIVDIATLTGAALMALGTRTAAVIGNDEQVLEQVEVAASATDESVWRLPLDSRYRSQLDSEIADIKNLGGKFAGTITAALFLSEWVGDTPWAHLDIAGTMRSDADEAYRVKGATGFGARLLAELARDFRVPTAG